jgi:lantibiotic biosynthesis protein
MRVVLPIPPPPRESDYCFAAPRISGVEAAPEIRQADPILRVSLYYGIPAVAFCLRILIMAGRRTADSERLQDLLDERTADIAGETGAHDVISGLTGLGRVLLDAGERHRPAVRRILSALTTLLHDLPDGVDLGLAHGLAGPLALLGIAARRGVSVPGQHEAVDATARRLVRCARRDSEGPYWPHVLDEFAAQDAVAPAPVAAKRAACCRGPLGTAVGLRSAALALEEPEWLQLAHEVMAASLRRSLRAPGGRESEPGLCHGAAGALVVATVVARHDRHPQLARLADRIAQRVLDEAAVAAPEAMFVTADRPGLLAGAAGVAPALSTWCGGPAASADGVPSGGAPSDAWAAALLVL